VEHRVVCAQTEDVEAVWAPGDYWFRCEGLPHIVLRFIRFLPTDRLPLSLLVTDYAGSSAGIAGSLSPKVGPFAMRPSSGSSLREPGHAGTSIDAGRELMIALLLVDGLRHIALAWVSAPTPALAGTHYAAA
jgi:hypothetical protein